MSFEYPLLAIIPQSETINGIAGGECSTAITFHIAVLDYITENYDNHQYSYLDKSGLCACNCNSRITCDSRNQFEIEHDTSILLKTSFDNYQPSELTIISDVKIVKIYYCHRIISMIIRVCISK